MPNNDPTGHFDSPDSEATLGEVIAAYLRSVESGQPISRDSLIEQHPELADELTSFFANHEKMDRLAEPLRASVTGSDEADGPPAKIRYFGDYELLEQIAQGGMGVVYKARQVSLNRPVAIKMIRSGMLATDVDVKRFAAEAEAAANLRHPGVVAIYEVGMHNNHHYYSMEYVEGHDLSQIARHEPLPPAKAAAYVRDMAEIIEFSHSRGVLHRDLKPANVLVDQHDRVRITDFGLAKRVGRDSDLTTTGQVLGTPKYMSPEQAAARHTLLGPASDVYAMGSILYELLTGRAPFHSDSAIDILRQIQQDDPIRPQLLNARLPKDLETICLKCLEKEPRRRYMRAQDLADELGRYLRGEPIRARPIGRLGRMCRWARRYPAVASLSALLLTLLSTVAIVAPPVAYKQAVLRQDADRLAGEKGALAGQLKKSLDMQKTATELAEQRRRDTERELRISTSLRLAAQSTWTRSVSPQRSLLLAVEAVESTRRNGEPVITEAEQALRDGLAVLGGVPLASGRIAVSPNGRWLAVAAGNRDIHLHDLLAERGVERPRILTGHNANVTKLLFSGDGGQLVSADERGSLHIWTTERGPSGDRPIHLTAPETPIEDWAISSNGQWLLIAGKPAVLFNLTAPNQSDSQIQLGDQQIDQVEVSSDGRWAITAAASDPTVGLWDLSAMDPRQSLRRLRGQGEGVNQVLVQPDTPFLVVAYTGKRLSTSVWRLDAGIQSTPLFDIEDGIHGIQVDRAGRWLVGLTAFRADVTPDSNAGKVSAHPYFGFASAVLDNRQQPLHSVSFNVTKAPAWNAVKLWDLTAADPAGTIRVLKQGTIGSAAFSPSGRLLAIQGRGINSDPYDLEIREMSHLEAEPDRFEVEGTPAASLVFSPNDQHLAIIDRSGRAKILRLEVLGDRPIDLPDETTTQSAQWSSDGRFLIVGGGSQSRVFDIAGGHLFASPQTLRVNGNFTGQFSSSADRRRLAGVDLQGKLAIWDLTTLTSLGSPLVFGPLSGLKLSPTGKRLLVVFSDGTIENWSLENHEATRERQIAPIKDLVPLKQTSLVAHIDDDGGRIFVTVINKRGLTTSVRRADVLESSEGSIAFNIGTQFQVDNLWQYLVKPETDRILVFDLRSSEYAKPRLVLNVPVDARQIPLCIGGQRDILFAALPGQLLAWNLRSNAPVPLQFPIKSTSPDVLVTSSDEQFLAVGDSETIWLYDFDGAKLTLKQQLRGHIGRPRLLAISGNRQHVAAYCNGVFYWTLRPGDQLPHPVELRPSTVDVRNIAFTSDNRYIMAEELGQAKLWSLDLTGLLAHARKTVGRELTSEERSQYRLPRR